MMPQGAKDHLGYVLGHQGDHEVLPLMQNAVEARTELAQSGQLAGNRCTSHARKRFYMYVSDKIAMELSLDAAPLAW